ncbi:response regulator [Neobacillus sp. SM06]|uniref:response regulator n=1 Tax=Neobacillus sp. SM06 TaxID=3422492 RepID=UPI003D2E1150
MDKIKVLICDDHEILRKGMIQLLKLRPGFEIVGEAANGKEAIALTDQLKPDIVLMDIQMPILDGIAATSVIRGKYPSMKIIMLTISDQEEDLFKAIQSGANGYLLKNTNLDDLFSNIKRVYNGTPTFSPVLATKIFEHFTVMNGSANKKQEYPLSDREKEILELVARGRTNQFIADALFISIHTVKKHMQHILEKLHVNNRAEAVSLALRNGLILEENSTQKNDDLSDFFNW